jgi:hypothetical protein
VIIDEIFSDSVSGSILDTWFKFILEDESIQEHYSDLTWEGLFLPGIVEPDDALKRGDWGIDGVNTVSDLVGVFNQLNPFAAYVVQVNANKLSTKTATRVLKLISRYGDFTNLKNSVMTFNTMVAPMGTEDYTVLGNIISLMDQNPDVVKNLENLLTERLRKKAKLSPEVSTYYAVANELNSVCKEYVAVDDALIAKLRLQLRSLQAKKTERQKEVSKIREVCKEIAASRTGKASKQEVMKLRSSYDKQSEAKRRQLSFANAKTIFEMNKSKESYNSMAKKYPLTALASQKDMFRKKRETFVTSTEEIIKQLSSKLPPSGESSMDVEEAESKDDADGYNIDYMFEASE